MLSIHRRTVRRFLGATARQWREVYVSIIFILLTTIVSLSLVVVVAHWKGYTIGELTRDPAAVRNYPLYIGFLSNLGIFIWAAAGAICLFSAALLKPSDLRQFLIATGLFTLYLGMDDAFMLHDIVYPQYLGLPDAIVFSGYAGILLVIMIRYYKVILESDYILFILACACFTLSVAIDQIDQHLEVVLFPKQWYHLWEDGPKFAGLVSWMMYLIHVAKKPFKKDWQGSPPGRPMVSEEVVERVAG